MADQPFPYYMCKFSKAVLPRCVACFGEVSRDPSPDGSQEGPNAQKSTNNTLCGEKVKLSESHLRTGLHAQKCTHNTLSGKGEAVLRPSGDGFQEGLNAQKLNYNILSGTSEIAAKPSADGSQEGLKMVSIREGVLTIRSCKDEAVLRPIRLGAL